MIDKKEAEADGLTWFVNQLNLLKDLYEGTDEGQNAINAQVFYATRQAQRQIDKRNKK